MTCFGWVIVGCVLQIAAFAVIIGLAWKLHGSYMARALGLAVAPTFVAVTALTALACGTLQQTAPTVIRGTLGGLYGACQTVDSDNATWRRICDGVEQAMPALNQLGAGPAELPPDVAQREVTITIGGE